MAAHLNRDGKFQSDKYPSCPPGKVPLSVEDETAQDLLWEYAQRRREVDEEFAEDLEAALRAAGYVPETSLLLHRVAEAAGVDDYESFGEVIRRVKTLHDAVLCSHRYVTAPDGDMCGDCGADLEDALTDGAICPARNETGTTVLREALEKIRDCTDDHEAEIIARTALKATEPPSC